MKSMLLASLSLFLSHMHRFDCGIRNYAAGDHKQPP